MDSSFLISIHGLIAILTCVLFVKLVIQFGWPNHPGRLTAFLIGLCATFYFVGSFIVDLGYVPQKAWEHWRALPLIAGSLCLLLQTMMAGGNFSLIQQKIISRIPLMGALICSTLFPQVALQLSMSFILCGALFFIISVRKSRYQKRIYYRLVIFILFYTFLMASQITVLLMLAQIFLIGAIFTLFAFENSFGVFALTDDFRQDSQGA